MQIMRYSEFKEVYNMLGGISLWADEGFPIVK
jgi:rhodanese-related sulfurtransferase